MESGISVSTVQTEAPRVKPEASCDVDDPPSKRSLCNGAGTSGPELLRLLHQTHEEADRLFRELHARGAVASAKQSLGHPDAIYDLLAVERQVALLRLSLAACCIGVTTGLGVHQ